MARSLESMLRDCGCDQAVSDFQDLLEELHKKHFPNWTVDEMLLHPEEAQFLCKDVRTKSPTYSDIPDDLILRALMHRRKQPPRT